MRAGVSHAIVFVIMRCVRRVIIAQKAKLENTHAGETAFCYQLPHFVGNIAQILGNNQLIACCFLYYVN